MITETGFTVRAREFQPAYLRLGFDEIERRAEEAVTTLASCQVCPRNCRVDRLQGRTAVCKSGRYALVGSHFPHFGEEDCLRGWNGSGTIFFSWCNLRCVFCQNFDISQKGEGNVTPPERLAAMMLELQARGCHNINFVTPEHVVPQILEALPLAIRGGLRLPIVYNTSAYDSLESLRWMDGIVDIYMPDFKVWDSAVAKRYLKAPDYPEAARAAVREMHRQVGSLVMDEHGLAQRGLLVRHLVMPGMLEETRHGIANYGGFVTVGDSKLQCTVFDLQGESWGPRTSVTRIWRDDVRRPTANGACEAVTASGLQPPPPITQIQ